MDAFDEKIKAELQKKESLPSVVEEKMEAAFHSLPLRQTRPARKKHLAGKILMPLAACVAATLCVGFANPTLAAKIPLIGNVFEFFKNEARTNKNPYFEGNPAKDAVTVNQSTAQTAGLEVNVQQISCDGANLYITYTAKDCGSSMADVYLMAKPSDMTVTLDGHKILTIMTLKPVGGNAFAAVQNIDLTEEELRENFSVPEKFKVAIQIRKFQLLVPVGPADSKGRYSRKEGGTVSGNWNFTFNVTQVKGNCKMISINQTRNGSTLQKLIQTPSTTAILLELPKSWDDPAVTVVDESGKKLEGINGYIREDKNRNYEYSRYSVTPEKAKVLIITVINKNGDSSVLARFKVDLTP